MSDEIIVKVLGTVMDLLLENNDDELNELLAKHPASSSEDDRTAAYAMLRYTCRYRWQLPNWVGLRERTYEAYRDHPDFKDGSLFAGLMDDERKPEPSYMAAFDALTGTPSPKKDKDGEI